MPTDSGGYGGYKLPSPVHFSAANGVHADIGKPPNKIHVSFVGQTTLPTFRIGGRPGRANDIQLHRLGGGLKF